MTDEEFRYLVRDWLARHLAGDSAGLRGIGGPGREHEAFEQRLAFDQELHQAGWTPLS